MRRFLTIVGLFSLPLLIGGLALELLLRSIPNDYAYKRAYLDTNASTLQLLSLGSSHGLSALRPELMDLRAFNAAHVSQTLQMDTYIFNRYIDHADSLRCVVLPMSYFSLVEEMDNIVEWWREKNYCIYYDYPSHPLSPLYHTELFGGPKITNDLLGALRYLTLGTTYRDTDTLGYRHRNHQHLCPSNLERNARETALLHTMTVPAEVIERNKKRVRHIASQCAARGITLVLLTTPTDPFYQHNIDPHQLQQVTDFCDSLSLAMTNVRYLNLFSSTLFHHTDFHDADHLCDEGAAKLSLLLRDSIAAWHSPKQQNNYLSQH